MSHSIAVWCHGYKNDNKTLFNDHKTRRKCCHRMRLVSFSIFTLIFHHHHHLLLLLLLLARKIESFNSFADWFLKTDNDAFIKEISCENQPIFMMRFMWQCDKTIASHAFIFSFYFDENFLLYSKLLGFDKECIFTLTKNASSH